jgi:hypothetical protein
MDTSMTSVVGRIAALRGARNSHVKHLHENCCAPCALHFIPKTEFLEAPYLGGIREETKELV